MPETRGGKHRIPVAKCEITATITLSKEKGVSALYCGTEKKIHTYLFDAEKWSMDDAKAWVGEHKDKQSEAEVTIPTLTLSWPAAQRLANGELNHIVHMGDFEEIALAPVTIVHEGKMYARVVLSRPVSIGADIYSYDVKVLEVYDPPMVLSSTTAYYLRHETYTTTPIMEGIRQILGSPGGKTRLAKTIKSLMPKHKTFVECAVGGGAVFFSKEKGISQVEVLNDVDPDLMSVYKFVRDASPDEIKRFKSLDWVLKRPLWEKLKTLKPKDLLQRAYRKIYVRLGSFAYGEDTYSPSKDGSEHKIGMPERFEQAKDRLQGVKLHNEDWLAVCKKYDAGDTFVFFDPPYPGDKPGWDKTAVGPSVQEIAQGLKPLESKWLLTINDTKEVISAFKGANIKRVQISSRAGRGGDMTSKADTELMIANYPLKGTQKESETIELNGMEYLIEIENVHVSDEEDTGKFTLLNEHVSWRLPPFSNEGGSYFLALTVRDIFPEHNVYCEPFCGASNILFSKYPVDIEVLNDTDTELIQAYEDIRALSLDQLIKLYRENWFPWKQKFEDLRDCEVQGELMRLYRFLYLSWYSFDSNRRDYRGRPKSWNLEARLGRVENARVRLREVKLTSEDGIACIKRWDSPTTAFFLDPPFDSDVENLRETLRSLQGKFVLRINDTPGHRDLLSEYSVMSTTAVKRAGQAPSWEDGRVVRARQELLVTNCPIEDTTMPQAEFEAIYDDAYFEAMDLEK